MSAFQLGTGRIVDRASRIAMAGLLGVGPKKSSCGFWFGECTGNSPPPSLVPSRDTHQEDAPI